MSQKLYTMGNIVKMVWQSNIYSEIHTGSESLPQYVNIVYSFHTMETLLLGKAVGNFHQNIFDEEKKSASV